MIKPSQAHLWRTNETTLAILEHFTEHKKSLITELLALSRKSNEIGEIKYLLGKIQQIDEIIDLEFLEEIVEDET